MLGADPTTSEFVNEVVNSEIAGSAPEANPSTLSYNASVAKIYS
jgi:hypothetical protein